MRNPITKLLTLWERALDLRQEELQLQRELLQQLPLLTREAFATSQLMATASAEQSKALANYFGALQSGYQAAAAPALAGPPQSSPSEHPGAEASMFPAYDDPYAEFLKFVKGEGSSR